MAAMGIAADKAPAEEAIQAALPQLLGQGLRSLVYLGTSDRLANVIRLGRPPGASSENARLTWTCA